MCVCVCVCVCVCACRGQPTNYPTDYNGQVIERRTEGEWKTDGVSTPAHICFQLIVYHVIFV